MKVLEEFRQFALRGNVVDMAVGIIIGGAFGKIVTSLVDDIVMPPLGVIIGGVDFTDLALTLKPAIGEQPAVTLNYGKFIQTSLNFTIIAFAIFLMVKVINSLRRKEEAAPVPPPLPSREETLLAEIRDILKKS